MKTMILLSLLLGGCTAVNQGPMLYSEDGNGNGWFTPCLVEDGHDCLGLPVVTESSINLEGTGEAHRYRIAPDGHIILE